MHAWPRKPFSMRGQIDSLTEQNPSALGSALEKPTSDRSARTAPDGDVASYGHSGLAQLVKGATVHEDC
jgi:hypothetical protein